MIRVAITGAGTVNPLGQNVPQTLRAMSEGACGIGPLSFRDADRLTIGIGAQVHGFDPSTHFEPRHLSMLDRFSQFALVAAQEATDQAGWPSDMGAPHRMGVIMGTAAGGLMTWEDSYRAVFEERRDRVHPLTVPRLMSNAAASQISMTYGCTGPCLTVSTACASSNHAIGQAFQMIRSGQADVMLCGGAEAMVSFGGIKAWEGLRVMSPDGCRPFSVDRNGMVLGEGAGVFVLEEWDHATRRNANILAEIVGFGMSADASDLVRPNVDGAAQAMRSALEGQTIHSASGLYINAHGTATKANDMAEGHAIRRVFGADTDSLLISSTKSLHGHLIGAAGAVELLACLLALGDGVIPPTVNHTKTDPECGVNIVANHAQPQSVQMALSNAFAFGGLNAVLALRSV